jgi:predicted HicB family RNase H-like nuclease
MAEKRSGPGRPPGRKFPDHVRVRLTENLRSRIVLLGEQNKSSLSEIVRQALELKLALHLHQQQ